MRFGCTKTKEIFIEVVTYIFKLLTLRVIAPGWIVLIGLSDSILKRGHQKYRNIFRKPK